MFHARLTARPDGGWDIAWPEAPERFVAAEALIRAVLDDGTLYDRLYAPGSVSGVGWQLDDATVSEAEQAEWREIHGWTDEDEAEDPLTYCALTGGPEPLIGTRRGLRDALYDAMSAVNAHRQAAAYAARVQSHVDWVEALPHAPIDLEQRPGPALTEALDALRALEARAAAVDAASDAEAVVSERQALLQELHRVGLFDQGPAAARRESLLDAHGLVGLARYARAAVQLHAYLASDARRQANPGAVPVPVLASPVSIDWFRLGPYVGGIVGPEAWVAWGEATAFDRRTWPEHAGTMFWSSGGYSETFVTQMDTPHRSSLARVGKPVEGAVLTASQTEGPLDATTRLEAAAAALIELGAHPRPGTPAGTSDNELLDLAIAMLAVRLTAVSQASGWYRIGLAALLRAGGDPVWRALAHGALRRALVEDPNHAGAAQLVIADVDSTPPIAGPGELLRRANVGAAKWHLALGRLAPEVRDEVIQAIAAPVAGNGPLMPALGFALRSGASVAPVSAPAVSAFTLRYVLKRLGAHAPEARESVRDALEALAASPHADALQPHLRLAVEAFGPGRKWWQFWR